MALSSLPTLDATKFTGLHSLDFEQPQTPDGRDHPFDAHTPLSFSDATDLPAPDDPTGAPVQNPITQATSSLNPDVSSIASLLDTFFGAGHSVKSLLVTGVVIVVAIGLILLSAYRIIK